MTARTTPLFRKQALASTRQRWFGPVRVVMLPSTLFTIILACGVVTMLGVAIVSIEIPDRVRTHGVLLPAEGLLKVKAPRSGRVERLPVANGDSVIPGQVLLRLSGSQRAPGREPELAARIGSLRRERPGGISRTAESPPAAARREANPSGAGRSADARGTDGHPDGPRRQYRPTRY